MSTPTNAGTVTGRVASTPKVFVTESGAKKVLFTLMVNRPHKNATTGQRDADAVPLEAWVRAETDGIGIFGFMDTGDLVSVSYTVRSSSLPDKETGEVPYRTSLYVIDVELLESKATTQQRRINRLQSQVNEQAATPVEPAKRTTRRKAA